MTMHRQGSRASVIMPSVALLSDTRADKAGSSVGIGAYRPWSFFKNTRERLRLSGGKMPVC